MYTLDATDSYSIEKPKGVYIYEIIEVADGIVSLSSDNSIRLIDPRSLSTEPLYTLAKAHAEVTCLKALDADNSIVCTAGRDGKVRITDLRQRSKIAELSSSKSFVVISRLLFSIVDTGVILDFDSPHGSRD